MRWLGKTPGPGIDPPYDVQAADHVDHRPPEGPAESLEFTLNEIEAASLAVYRAHGLPTRPGHYVRGRRGNRWRFVGRDLSPEERWSFIENKGSGTRYSTLANVGRDHEAAEVQLAACLLNRCREMRVRATSSSLSRSRRADLEAALMLGADWQGLRQALAWREQGKLRFLPPRGRR